MNKTVLVTGISGFIGSNLYKSFDLDYHIYGLDIVNINQVPKDRFLNWDNLYHISGLDTIIHLAGKAHDTLNTSAHEEYVNINVGLTKTIFQYFLKSQCKNFIFFSSVKAVTDSVKNQLTEETLPDPKTPYGRSKLEAEEYILNQFEQWKTEESANGKITSWKKVYILRPGMVHGPGNKGNLNTLFSFQRKKLPWPLGAYENKRSYCSVGNLLFVVKQLIERDIDSGVYQVVDDESLSTNELIRLISDSLGTKANIWNISPRLISLIARMGDMTGMPLNQERLKKLTESYVISNKKIKSALGLEQMPIRAIEGMKTTIDFFKNEIS
jgi:nucleoside-diphosphate-sugar epimerase